MCTRCFAPAAAASRATRAGPSTCSSGNRCRPRSERMPTDDTTALAPSSADARIDQRDLADIAHRLQEPRLGRMPAHDAHHGSAFRQSLHDITSDETGSADHADAPIAHERPPLIAWPYH